MTVCVCAVYVCVCVCARARACMQRIIAAIPSGGVVVNDCMVQQGQPHVPFGGRGESGLGTQFLALLVQKYKY